MQIGMIGLGRMGGNMVRRLLAANHQCVVYDRRRRPPALIDAGALGSTRWSISFRSWNRPSVWLMLPAAVVDSALPSLPHLAATSSSMAATRTMWTRSGEPSPRGDGVHFVTSASAAAYGASERGYCLMIGGRKRPVSPRACVSRAGAGAKARRQRRAARRRRPTKGIYTGLPAPTAS